MEDRLDGWKEIAAFIRREMHTARKRARLYGMPVYKLAGGVVAYKDEIREWEKYNAVRIK